MIKLITPNTDEIFVTFYHEATGEGTYYVSEHALVYVARGSLDVLLDGKPVATFKETECVFVRKDHRMTLVNYPSDETGFHLSIFLFFPRHLLFEFYKTFSEKDLPKKVVRSNNSFLKISRSSLLTSLFDSFRPYWKSGDHFEGHWIRVKVFEAIRLILREDESTYASLFDFTSRWRLDIMEFMEKNYMYDLSVNDLANYTGRSVATFKRDFSKLSNLSPRNWIIRRRLKAARRLLLTTEWPIHKVMDVSGFKNFSHFCRAYRQIYGQTPSETRKIN